MNIVTVDYSGRAAAVLKRNYQVIPSGNYEV